MRAQTAEGVDGEVLRLLHRGVLDFIEQCPKDSGTYYTRLHDLPLARISIEELAHRFRFIRYLLAPIPQDAAVLEAGSGLGVNLVIMRLLGWTNVSGVELVEQIWQISTALVEHLSRVPGLDLSGVKPVNADVQFSGLPGESYDCLASIEAMSHIPSVDAFLREANRLLRPGGTLIISDSTNTSSPLGRRQLRKLWERLREEELERRLRFVAERRPDLDPQFRASIVLHTELLCKRDLDDTIDQIASSKRLPMNLWNEHQAPVFFESGIWAERAFRLQEVEEMLVRYGFSPRIRLSAGATRGPAFRALESLVNCLPRRIRYHLHHAYRCWATKVDECRYLVH